MNILLLMIPKVETGWIYDDFTYKQCIMKMRHYGYTAMPVVTGEGMYKGIISEGDLLKGIFEQCDKKELNTEKMYISDIEEIKERKSLKWNTPFDILLETIKNQNFVPIVDDRNAYMGIITRKKVLEYLKNKATNS